MVAALTLFLFVALFFVFLKFTSLNDRVEFLEEQIRTLKNELSRLRYSKTAGASAQEMQAPASTDPQATVSPDEDHIIPAAPVAEKSIPTPETTGYTYKPVEIPPAGEIPPATPVPPPPMIERSPMPSVPLDESPSAFSNQKSEISASAASVETERKKEDSKSKMAFEPPATSALEEKWEDFKKNVDWEQFTGVKLFAWLGGLALFIGAIFFVKYSIDNNLIPPQLRLAIGALVGLAMVGSSLFINRDRYNTTAHTMAAGGIAVLYAVSFTACVYYGFIPKMIGFGLFALISAAAFVLAVFHQGRFISVLGAVGAYATPLLIQTGHPNLIGLFIYLTVVNIGLLEVIRRTGWLPLSILVTAGTLLTLSAGAWGTHPPAEPYLITLITIANAMVFSLFFWIYRGDNADSPFILFSLRTLFASTLPVAILLINTPTGFNYLPLLLITAATGLALILAYAERTWGVGFIVYAFSGFLIIGAWSFLKFDLSKPSWEMLIFFIYAVIAGLGPVFVIRKHGLEAGNLIWLKIFPALLTALALVIFLKHETASFLFWPMLVGIGVIGIFVGMMIGSLLSVGALILLLLTGGVGWILKTPVLQIGNEFFIFILVAGLLICFLTVLFLKKADQWSLVSPDDASTRSFSGPFSFPSAWITAFPVLGPFILLSIVLMRQAPLSPNPAMAAGLCFFAVAVFLSRYFASQEILTVSLTAMTFTLLSWGSRQDAGAQIHLLLLTWSAFLWALAVILPNVLFRPEKEWKMAWCAWAVFELFMACLVVFTVDSLWRRDIAGWIPLALAILKLPVIVLLLKRLEGDEARNTVLAFHGGVVLFYVSSISVLLLGNSWIGVSFVIEATLLLWLNRRIEHPGLRWVALGLAPIGLTLVLTHLGALKSASDMPVLNLAVFSCAICVLALFIAVKLADHPREELIADFSLPQYFLWLSCGSAFFLLNLIVSDIFGGTGGGFKLEFYLNIHQYISHTLLWIVFAALMLRLRLIPPGLKIAGLIIFLMGLAVAFYAPFYFNRQIATMTPLFNPLLILFGPVLAVLIYLAYVQNDDDRDGSQLKNLYISLGIIAGLLTLTTEISTIFNHMTPFHLFYGHSSAMALALILSWFIFGLGLVWWPRPLHDYFRLAGAVLILISLARSIYYPLAYARDFGAVTPILNMPSLIFLFFIACLGALSLKSYDRNLSFNDTSFSPGYLWGAILIVFTFYVTNVEVASVFGMFNTQAEAGRFTFYTHGRLSQQLAYSISWLIFAIILLSIGIRWQLIYIRWVALALLVITSLKVFIKDLWALGQLYRVFSFIGLAVTLILVSFIYQRYLGSSTKVKEKINEKN